MTIKVGKLESLALNYMNYINQTQLFSKIKRNSTIIVAVYIIAVYIMLYYIILLILEPLRKKDMTCAR